MAISPVSGFSGYLYQFLNRANSDISGAGRAELDRTGVQRCKT